jgi:hypothetical protein
MAGLRPVVDVEVEREQRLPREVRHCIAMKASLVPMEDLVLHTANNTQVKNVFIHLRFGMG